MAALPPPPTNDATGSFAWLEWFRQLRAYISTVGSVPWNIIDFAGSTLSSIASRSHQVLQALQGGTTGEYFHLTSSEYTGSGTGAFARTGNPTLQGVTVSGLAYVGDTTAPAGQTQLNLMVSTNTAAGSPFLLRKSCDAINGPNFTFLKSRGTAAAPSAVAADDATGTVAFAGFDGTNYANSAQILAFVDGTVSTGVVPTRLRFLTADSSGVLVEALRIDSAQVVTLGGISTAPALKVVPDATPSTQRHVLITAGAAAGNPTIGVSGGNLAISASVAITGVVNVGNTTAPAGDSSFTQLGLLVSTDTAIGSPMMLRKSVSAINGSNFRFLKSRGTAASPTTVASGDYLGSISCDGFDGTNYLQSGTIVCGVDAAVSTGIVPTFIAISTANTSGTLTEAFRITSEQRVVVAKTIATGGYTVATLPAGTVGDRAYVTDALAPAYGVAVAGGGAVTIPVFYNGAAWICA